MGGTELKTDSFQRWVMYRKDDYGSGRIFLSTEQKEAVEEGKKFSQRAYADVWAKDAALVRRVRAFLGTNFYWHERLAKNGADVEVVETLQSMIRGESVVLIAEQSRTGGAVGNPVPKPERVPSFRSSLMNDCGMSYDAATAYIDRYNDIVDRANAVTARYANAAPSSLVDAASDLTETATPLGDAQPFDYAPDPVSGDTEELAASTNNPRYAAKMLGYDYKTFGTMLHKFKDANRLGPADNSIFHDNGNVEFNGKIFEDSIHDYAP
ncbi:hypothetical protein C8K18_12631 [Paraburkholderia sp. GV068]|uniref:hypothetical protein n=1 Tax=Paraburkholderia TaxID=1822464 RepID=UPI000D316D6F|nr:MULTISPECIES: hypothetical protein [Paraburkholderia]MDR6476257.1 hypothetical protein [Paraburkholderia graminis]PTQ91748.1 hypothetical protein C8K19_12627 [Paraburkholderia sp. GV072]PUA93987.1 hypothetical protein C8K18_12631 [Paraburkholderia sp. GV068]